MAIEPFTAEDDVAAKAWLAIPSNRNFGEWKSARTEDVEAWEDLIDRLEEVTAFEAREINDLFKIVCPRHLSTTKTRTHTDLDQRKKIAEEVCTLIVQDSSSNTIQLLAGWVTKALRAFAPRGIKLWKKSTGYRRCRKPKARTSEE